MKICFLAKSTIFDTENIFTCKNTFFLQLFLLPQELDLPSTGGIHCGFAWRCFPILGLELKFFGVDGGFPHSPGSTGSGHFLYTIVSRLGSCCKFSPLLSLLDNHMGVRSTSVRTIVCTPLQDLNPQPSRGPSQTPLLLVFIGPTPHSVSTSLGIVGKLIHSLGGGSLADKPCASWCPCPPIAGLQYWATGTD